MGMGNTPSRICYGCGFAHSRYQSRQSALATDADVLTFMPHKICFTAPSTLPTRVSKSATFPVQSQDMRLTYFFPLVVTGISGH